MGDLFGPQHRTLYSRQPLYDIDCGCECKYFCGPGGVARRLRYNNITMPVKPRRRSNRDRVMLLRNTLLWGICALAAFQLSPPLERSMANSSSGRPDHAVVYNRLSQVRYRSWPQPFTRCRQQVDDENCLFCFRYVRCRQLRCSTSLPYHRGSVRFRSALALSVVVVGRGDPDMLVQGFR